MSMGNDYPMTETTPSSDSIRSNLYIPSKTTEEFLRKYVSRKRGTEPIHGQTLEVPKTYGTLVSPNNHSIKHNAESKPQRKISRSVTKTGSSNVTPSNFKSEGFPFFVDTFTTLLEASWIWTLVAFTLSYVISWLCFAGFWYLIVYYHGDLDPVNAQNETWIPCISSMKDFTSAFLFSVETQHTTGYGYYHITEKCPPAILCLCAQSIFGVILEGVLVGLVFAKLARPKSRSATLMFSKNSVISQREGGLCFMFRVADMRKSNLLDARIRAHLIKRLVNERGEVTISYEELDVKGEGEKDNKLLLFWPTLVIHRIDQASPLYRLSPTDLTPDNTKFEIIVVLEGIVEATGLITQKRSSYMPSEVLWGYRFQSVTTKKSKTGERLIDLSKFHEVVHIPTSPLSAHQIDTLSNS